MLATLATTTSPQAFLGAPWIERLVSTAPAAHRRSLALRLLSLSPHYFYPDERGMLGLEREFQRNLESRQLIARRVVSRYIGPDATVLDLGCGPGFLARALADYADRVIACDISRGALACARVVNPCPTVRYALARSDRELPVPAASIDVVCSFAVIQHVTEAQFCFILRDLFRVLKPNGMAVCHVPTDDPRWRSEAEWRADTSWGGRLKLRYGLNCFGRTTPGVRAAIRAAGFSEPAVSAVGSYGDVRDADLEGQDLFVFGKPLNDSRV